MYVQHKTSDWPIAKLLGPTGDEDQSQLKPIQ